ncbi:DUF3397 family protein [Planomicrobium sp. CPCC 101079]|uniref:DUF3397 family protein n=1 Tax=Planomicrobium sp. CPCC 101079 TaxID=2599618 RepID=UPI0011B7D9AC|nr:DUF3397 family protein [Planomicrobium sp. CPCC 101079]TWT04726.1 DUF3397 domain-containing protein [Planomicrobium sp. CPCC 101079]
MMIIVQTIGAVFIFAPFIAFLLIFFAARKTLNRKAFEAAADFTTLLLFFAIPVMIYAIWNYQASSLMGYAAISLAIGFLIVEWKRTKEIKVLVFLRKTWRMYFLVLTVAYFIIWIAGFTYTVSGFLLDSYGA